MYPQKKRPQDPPPQQPPQSHDHLQDPLAAVLLYLGHLDHGLLYSEGELARAINDCHRSYGNPVDLGTWYGQSLNAGGTEKAAATVRARRAWALRIAADLAHRHPHDRSLPWASGVTLSDALQTGARRTLRGVRRHAFLVAAPVIVLYVMISGLSEVARDFMAVSVAGPLNVGLLLGLVQLVAVAAWVQWYARYCGTSVDPLVESLGTNVERLEHRP
ncbi:hypothetical protein SGFS_074650 [Streptomyces graminofaciens]|uniref:DUF485 domain-containing protein n=1 Tax=Streptomyces graminofaciens TaxID=68212 RepID=A0ABN5VSL7_9ACTN|nr:DUF485 domain-containing protein [Streptomyces graminofaciens]BBC36171.1 hypothetical protein SGFS_074650 [Streptomyces graminofaciens]